MNEAEVLARIKVDVDDSVNAICESADIATDLKSHPTIQCKNKATWIVFVTCPNCGPGHSLACDMHARDFEDGEVQFKCDKHGLEITFIRKERI